jgi:hypothetical protein
MISESTYNEYKARREAYWEWAGQYVQPNGWTVIPAGVTPPAEANSTNEERAAMEVYEWHHDKPTEYFLYIKDRIATTWTGEKLGTVSFKNEWRSNMGDVRISIDVRGTNGVKYHGIYYKSAGDYARITAYKAQRV